LKKPLAAASGSRAHSRPIRSADSSALRHHAYSRSDVGRDTNGIPSSSSVAVIGIGSP